MWPHLFIVVRRAENCHAYTLHVSAWDTAGLLPVLHVCLHGSITWSLKALFYYLLETNTEESTYKTCHKIFILSVFFFFFVVLIYRCWGRRKPATVRTLLRKPTSAGWWTPENTGRALHPSGPTARKDSGLHGCKDAALFKLLTWGRERGRTQTGNFLLSLSAEVVLLDILDL